MGKITTGDNCDSAIKPVRRLSDTLSKPEMLMKGLSGESNPHQFKICKLSSQKIKRYHRGMIKLTPSPAFCSRRNSPILRKTAQLGDKLRVINSAYLKLRISVKSEIPLRPRSRRNMKIILVHNGMR